MKPLDREEYVDDIASLLSTWEPSVRSHIEEILHFARFAGDEMADDAAIALLSKIKSIQIIHALRRHITSDEPGRGTNVCILLSAIAQNSMLDYNIRFDTLEYYIHNPRYKLDKMMNLTLSEALEFLEAELVEKFNSLKIAKALLDELEI